MVAFSFNVHNLYFLELLTLKYENANKDIEKFSEIQLNAFMENVREKEKQLQARLKFQKELGKFSRK
jgi:hypothetical protein